jgi:zinc protease
VTALVTPEPTRGRIASEHAIENVQAWEWVLSNGMHVILKPTRFTFDEIQVRAVAPGGASLAADADYPSAWLADAIIQNTGVGALSGVRLERMLDSTSISLAPTVSDDMIMLSGSTAPRDLNTFFQVLHLYFTAPRGDTVAFRRYRDRMQAAAASRDRDPDAVFLDTVAAVASGHHPRRLRSGVHFYESTRLPAAIAFWKARVANASGFTVVVTGDFTLDDMRPLVERYLASLPAGHPEQPRSVGFRADPGVVRREVVAGVAGRARTRIVLSGPIDVTSRAVEDLREVKDLVESSLDERLREAMGATYGVQVGSEVDLVPPTTYSLFVDFEASPERIDAVGAAALEELERLRTQGPTAAEFDRTRAARMRDYDGELESNDYWTSELSQHSRLGWPLTTIATHRQDVEGLEPATLRAAAATYLSTRRMTRVTTRPRAARPR